MLRSLSIIAELGHVDGTHLLFWKRTLELSLDCPICRREGRTIGLTWGDEVGDCSGSGMSLPRHPAPARITAFDTTHSQAGLALHAVVDYWWAPFTDPKSGEPATALTRAPWVRLHVGYRCPDAQQSGEDSIQSNLVRPTRLLCQHCGLAIATSRTAPVIRSLT